MAEHVHHNEAARNWLPVSVAITFRRIGVPGIPEELTGARVQRNHPGGAHHDILLAVRGAYAIGVERTPVGRKDWLFVFYDITDEPFWASFSRVCG